MLDYQARTLLTILQSLRTLDSVMGLHTQAFSSISSQQKMQCSFLLRWTINLVIEQAHIVFVNIINEAYRKFSQLRRQPDQRQQKYIRVLDRIEHLQKMIDQERAQRLQLEKEIIKKTNNVKNQIREEMMLVKNQIKEEFQLKVQQLKGQVKGEIESSAQKLKIEMKGMKEEILQEINKIFQSSQNRQYPQVNPKQSQPFIKESKQHRKSSTEPKRFINQYFKDSGKAQKVVKKQFRQLYQSLSLITKTYPTSQQYKLRDNRSGKSAVILGWK